MLNLILKLKAQKTKKKNKKRKNKKIYNARGRDAHFPRFKQQLLFQIFANMAC